MSDAESILQSLGLVGLRLNYTDPVIPYTPPSSISLSERLDVYLNDNNDNAAFAISRALWTAATDIPAPTITLKQFIQSFLAAIAAVFQARGMQQIAEQLRIQHNIDRILGNVASRVEKFEKDTSRQITAINRYLAVMPGASSMIPEMPEISADSFSNTPPVSSATARSAMGLELPSILEGSGPSLPALSENLDNFIARLYINMVHDGLLQISTNTQGASGASSTPGIGLVDTLKRILITHSGEIDDEVTDPEFISPYTSADDTEHPEMGAFLYKTLKEFEGVWNPIVTAILDASSTWADPTSATFGNAGSFANISAIREALNYIPSSQQTAYLAPVRSDIVNWIADVNDASKTLSDYFNDKDEVLNHFTALATNVTPFQNVLFSGEGGAAGIAVSTAESLESSTIGPFWDGIVKDGTLYSGSPSSYLIKSGSSYYNPADGLFYKAKRDIVTCSNLASTKSSTEEWGSETSYNTADIVTYQGDYFRSKVSGNLNHAPIAGETTDYWAPAFLAENFRSDVSTYVTGDHVYYPADSGNLFECVALSLPAGTNPSTDTNSWVQVNFSNVQVFTAQSSYEFQVGAMMKAVAQGLANVGTQLTSDYIGIWDNEADYLAGGIVSQDDNYYYIDQNIVQKGDYSTAATYSTGDVFEDEIDQIWITKPSITAFNADNFVITNEHATGAEVSYADNLYKRNSTAIDTFSGTASYNLNEYVKIEGVTYKLSEDINYQGAISEAVFPSAALNFNENDAFTYDNNEYWLKNSAPLVGYVDSGSTYVPGNYVVHNGAIYKRNEEDVADFSLTASYTANDYVIINSLAYKVLQTINYISTYNSSTFADAATSLVANDSFVFGTNSYFLKVDSPLTSFEDAPGNYSSGDYVNYNGAIYKRSEVAYTTGDFTPDVAPTYWSSVSVADYIQAEVDAQNMVLIAPDAAPGYLFHLGLTPPSATYWESKTADQFISEMVAAENYIFIDTSSPSATLFTNSYPLPTNTTYWNPLNVSTWAASRSNEFELYSGPIFDFFTLNVTQTANIATVRSQAQQLLSKLNNYMGGFIPPFSPLSSYAEGEYLYANGHSYQVKNGINITQKGSFDPTNLYGTGEVFTLSGFEPYSIVTAYIAGDYVVQGGKTWRCILANTGRDPTLATNSSYWSEVAPTVNIPVLSIFPSYNSAKSYTPGETVSYDNDYWQATRPVPADLTPLSGSSYWANITDSLSSMSLQVNYEYNSRAIYHEGDYVTDGTDTWKSVGTTPAGQTPASSSSYWNQVVYAAPYNSSVTYSPNHYATYNGDTWCCLSVAMNQTPAEGDYWTKVTNTVDNIYNDIVLTHAHGPSVYDFNSTYSSNDIVYYNGDLYKRTSQEQPAERKALPISGEPYYEQGEVFTYGSTYFQVIPEALTYKGNYSVTSSGTFSPTTSYSPGTTITAGDSIYLVTSSSEGLSNYNPASNYEIGSYVYYSGSIWKAIAAASAGETPSGASTKWKAYSDASYLHASGNFKILATSSFDLNPRGMTPSDGIATAGITYLEGSTVSAAGLVYKTLTEASIPLYSESADYAAGDFVYTNVWNPLKGADDKQIWICTQSITRDLEDPSNPSYDPKQASSYWSASTAAAFVVNSGNFLPLYQTAITPISSHPALVLGDSFIYKNITYVTMAATGGISAYSSSATYGIGSYCYAGGKIWQLTEAFAGANTSPSDTSSNWTEVSLDFYIAQSGLFMPLAEVDGYIYDSTRDISIDLSNNFALGDIITINGTTNGFTYVINSDFHGLSSYSSTTNYSRGDYVSYNGSVWQRTSAAFPAGSSLPPSTTSKYWTKISLSSFLSTSDLSVLFLPASATLERVGDFSLSSSYEVGDTFDYNGRSYVTVGATSGLANYSPSETYTVGDYVSHNGSIWQRTAIAFISSNIAPAQNKYWTLVSTPSYIQNSGYFNVLATAPSNLFLDVSTPGVTPKSSQDSYWEKIVNATWVLDDINSSDPHFQIFSVPKDAGELPSFFFTKDPVSAPADNSASKIDTQVTALVSILGSFNGFLDILDTETKILRNYVNQVTTNSQFASAISRFIRNVLINQQEMLLGKEPDAPTPSELSSATMADCYDVLNSWKSALNTILSGDTSILGTRVGICSTAYSLVSNLLACVTADESHSLTGPGGTSIAASNVSAVETDISSFVSYVTSDYSGIQASIQSVVDGLQSMFRGEIFDPVGTYQHAAQVALNDFNDYYQNSFKTISTEKGNVNVQLANGYLSLSSLFEAISGNLQFRSDISGSRVTSVLPTVAANSVQERLRNIFDILTVNQATAAPSLWYYYVLHNYEVATSSILGAFGSAAYWNTQLNNAISALGGSVVGSSGNPGYLANLNNAFQTLKHQMLKPTEDTRMVCGINGNNLRFLNTGSTTASLQTFYGLRSNIIQLLNGLDDALTKFDFTAPSAGSSGATNLLTNIVRVSGEINRDPAKNLLSFINSNIGPAVINFINGTLVVNQSELINDDQTPIALPSSDPTPADVRSVLTSWSTALLNSGNTLMYNVVQALLAHIADVASFGTNYVLTDNRALSNAVNALIASDYEGPINRGTTVAISALSSIASTDDTAALKNAYTSFINNVLVPYSVNLIGLQQQNFVQTLSDSPTLSEVVSVLQSWKTCLNHTTSIFISYDAPRAVFATRVADFITQMLDYYNAIGSTVILHGGDSDISLNTAATNLKTLRVTSELAPIIGASQVKIGNENRYLGWVPNYKATFRTELTDASSSPYSVSDAATNRYGFDPFSGRRRPGLFNTFTPTLDPLTHPIDCVNNKIKITGHGFSNGDKVIFDNCGLPDIGDLISVNFTGASSYQFNVYYVISATANDFQLSLTPGGAPINLGTSPPEPTFRPLQDGFENYEALPYVIRSDYVEYSNSTSVAAMTLLQMIASLQNFFSKTQAIRTWGITDSPGYGGGTGTMVDIGTWGTMDGRMTDVAYNLYIDYSLFNSLFTEVGVMRPHFLWSARYLQNLMEDSYRQAKDYFERTVDQISAFQTTFNQFHMAVELNVTRWMTQAFATTSVAEDIMYRIFESDPVSPQESRLAAKVLSMLLTIIIAMLASNPGVRNAVLGLAAGTITLAQISSSLTIEVSLANAMIQRAAALAADLLDRERSNREGSAEFIASSPVSAQSLFDLASFYQTNMAQHNEIMRASEQARDFQNRNNL